MSITCISFSNKSPHRRWVHLSNHLSLFPYRFQLLPPTLHWTINMFIIDQQTKEHQHHNRSLPFPIWHTPGTLDTTTRQSIEFILPHRHMLIFWIVTIIQPKPANILNDGIFAISFPIPWVFINSSGYRSSIGDTQMIMTKYENYCRHKTCDFGDCIAFELFIMQTKSHEQIIWAGSDKECVCSEINKHNLSILKLNDSNRSTWSISNVFIVNLMFIKLHLQNC